MVTMSSKVLNKLPTKKLTKAQLKQVASFTDPGSVLTALDKEGWTIEESIKHLVDIAKGSREVVTKGDTEIEKEVKTSVQLNAIKYLNQLIIDAMKHSGLMVMATRKFVDDEGDEFKLSGQLVSSDLRSDEDHTTPEELTGKGHDSNGEENEEERNSLCTSKPPKGNSAEAGHFDGISTEGISEKENLGKDFL